MNKPDISIIIPTYNRAAILKDAIRSCIVQQGVKKEIIVINDGSTDNTKEVAKSFEESDGIRYIETENEGANHARNVGLRSARGDFVKFLDSDDVLVEGVLFRELALAKRTKADVVYSNWITCEMSSDWKEKKGTYKKQTAPEISKPIIDSLILGKAVPTSAALYRYDYIRGLEWDEKKYCLNDWEWFILCGFREGTYVKLDMESYQWRQHDNPRVTDVTMHEYAIIHHACLDMLCDFMEKKGIFNSRRKKRMAQYYYTQLQVFYENDRESFKKGMDKIHSLGGEGFLPEESRYMMRILIRTFGIEKAFKLWTFLKNVLKRGKNG